MLSFFIQYQLVARPPLDSLLRAWEEKKNAPGDTATVRLLLRIAETYRYNKADSGVFYSSLAEEYAERLGFDRARGDALTEKGIGYYILGEYDLSLSAHTQALEIHKEVGSEGGMAQSINGIALVYMGQDDLREAIPYLRSAIRLNVSGRRYLQLANNYFNMGIIYDHLEVFDSAHYYLDLAESMADRTESFRTKLMVNNRIAETLFRQARYEEARRQYQAVLDADYYQSNWETSFAYAGLAQAYNKLGDYPRAIDAGKQAVKYAEMVGANWDMARALEILTEAYEGAGDYQNAFFTHKRFKAADDSLFNQDKEREINYLLLKQKEIENRELQAENELKEQQLQKNRLVSAIFAVIVVSLAVIGLIVVRNSRQKEKLNRSLLQKNRDIEEQKRLIEEQNATLSRLNKTHALILSIISHDLRSPVASLQSMVHLFLEETVSPDEQRGMFLELEKRIESIAAMMNSLLLWADGQFRGVKASPEPLVIADVVAELLPAYDHKLEEKQIELRHSPGQRTEIMADPSQVRIIVQNLISNAIKFTHSGGCIEVYYTAEGDTLSLHVKDSGIGMDERMTQAIQAASGRVTGLGTHNEVGTGLGLVLVRQFAEHNKGKLSIQSTPGKGSEFTVSFLKA